MEGFIATALVMIDRTGGTVAVLDDKPEPDLRDVSVGPGGARPQGDAGRLIALAAEHSRSMPV